MTYDHKAQELLNQQHVKVPQPGDYWHEMFCPTARVLGATDSHVIVQNIIGMAGKEIDDENPQPKTMTLAAFKKWLSYSSMPDKTYCSVIPRHIPPEPRP